MGDSLSARYEYVELLCDSSGATVSNSSVGTPTSWPKFYFTEKNFRPAGIKIVSAEVPFIFDTISTSNNVITLNDGPSYTITITPGTYTGPALATEMQTLFNVASAGYTVVWSSDTFRFTFTGVAPFTITLPTVSADLQLGFKTGAWASGVGNILVSPYAAAPSGPFYLYLNSETVGPVVNAYIQDGEHRINQLCRIPINVQKGSVIFYADTNPQQFFDFTPATFNSLDLYLTLGFDQAQLPLDLKGVGFSVKVGILNYREGGVPIGQKPASSRFLMPR
jgi:hypothetical protein